MIPYLLPELSLCSYITLGAYDKKPNVGLVPSSHSKPSANELYLFAQKDFPGRVDIGKADTGSELVQLGLDTIIFCYCYSRVCVRRKSSEDGLC